MKNLWLFKNLQSTINLRYPISSQLQAVQTLNEILLSKYNDGGRLLISAVQRGITHSQASAGTSHANTHNCTQVLNRKLGTLTFSALLVCFFFFYNTRLLKQLLSAVLCVLSIWPSLLFYLSSTSSKTRSQQNLLSFNCLVRCFSLFKVLPVFYVYLKRI